MPLVKAICTNCSAPLEVDTANEIAICPYCSTPYIIEKAINQYVMNYDTLKASVAGMVNENKTENAFKNAETLLMLGEFREAFKSFRELSHTHAYDPRAWSGLLSAKSHNKRYYRFDRSELEEISKYYKHLRKIDPAKAREWDEYYAEIVNNFNAGVKKLNGLTKTKSDLEDSIYTLEKSALVTGILSGCLLFFLLLLRRVLMNESRWAFLIPLFVILGIGCVALAMFLLRQLKRAKLASVVNEINKLRGELY